MLESFTHVQDAATGRPQFDSSAMGCEYHEYRRRDVLQCLARPKGQAALVMIGEHLPDIPLPMDDKAFGAVSTLAQHSS
jgi:hypothetical protein